MEEKKLLNWDERSRRAKEKNGESRRRNRIRGLLVGGLVVAHGGKRHDLAISEEVPEGERPGEGVELHSLGRIARKGLMQAMGERGKTVSELGVRQMTWGGSRRGGEKGLRRKCRNHVASGIVAIRMAYSTQKY